MALLAATGTGLHRLDGAGEVWLEGHAVDTVARAEGGWWALADGAAVWFVPDAGEPREVATIAGAAGECLLALDDGLLVGGGGARLYRVAAAGGAASEDPGFAAAPGRAEWYTPWGGPPAVRSLARDVDGTVYLNVHVGGILRLRPGGSWEPTIDIDADVHQVTAHPERAATAVAAAAVGLLTTTDGARSWTTRTDGLHASYCRAVAVSRDRVYVSASRGPGGAQAAVYHTGLAGPLERCRAGLPEWFTGNVDTGCLAAAGERAMIGDASGTVYLSEDGGQTWEEVARGLGTVTAVAISLD